MEEPIPFSILLSGTVLGLNGIWITMLFSFAVAFICEVVIDKHSLKKAENRNN